MSEASFLESGAAPAAANAGGSAPPRLSGGLPLLGHLLDLRRRPIELFWRVRNECGEIGEMNWAGTRVVLLTGEPAQEAFFRAEEEQLDQAAAYPFMTPIFGRGVVFDATPEQRTEFEEQMKRMLFPDEAITTRVDIGDLLEAKWRALNRHVTQMAPDFPFIAIGIDGWREFGASETFVLREFRGVDVELPETDLFAGLEAAAARSVS